MRSLVVSHDAFDPTNTRLRGVIRSLLDNQTAELATYADAEQRMFQVQPDIVFLVLSPDPSSALTILPRLRKGKACYFLCVGPAHDSRTILAALQNGADHYLDEDDLDNGLRAVVARFKVNKEPLAATGRLIAILSASGGAGASTLAANLAVALARDQKRCALVDLNPGRGDQAALLDLKPVFTLADVCAHAGRLDQAMLEKVLARHACGVHLLAAPHEYAEARAITSHGVNLALTVARSMFPYVVVDLEDCFHEEQVAALRQATAVFLVVRLDFTSLRHARRALKHLVDLGIPRGQVRLVVNRHGQPNELPVDESEDALGDKLSLFVPDDPRIFNVANNTGVPALLKEPQAKVCQSIAELARVAGERRKNERPVLVGAGR